MGKGKTIVPLLIAGVAMGYAFISNDHVGELEDILSRKKSDLGTFMSLSTRMTNSSTREIASANGGINGQKIDEVGLETVTAIQKAATSMGLGDSVAGIRQLKDGSNIRYRASFDTVDVNTLLSFLQDLEKTQGISTVSVDLGKGAQGPGLRAEVTLQQK
jgi:hypothetical protein